MTKPTATPILFHVLPFAMSTEMQSLRSTESLPQPMAGMASALTRLLSTDADQKLAVESALKRKRPAEDKSKQLRKLKKDRPAVKPKELGSDVLKMCHAPPDPAHWDYEKRLQRIATRGVVQVFNAVHKQQQELESKLKEVGPSESKRSKVMQSIDKGSFLDMLKGGSTSGTNKKSSSSQPQAEQPSWSLLRDDYSLKAGMKEWATDGESQETGPGDDSTDSDDDV